MGIKLDDNFHDHPKVLRAGAYAVGLHVMALTHCSLHLTDGHVSCEFVRQKVGRQGVKLAAALVEAGLWEQNGHGWTIHDYLDHNPSRAKIMDKRARDVARKASRNG